MPADPNLAFTLQNMQLKYLPELPLPLLATTRVLILGAGTIGCHLARALLSWGIVNISFLDHGLVRPTNPTRQCLYTVADVGQPKAAAAAAALLTLSPAAAGTGHVQSIPTPGRGQGVGEEGLAAFTQLLLGHDAVFLCTDSRESRWLPSYLCSLHALPAIAVGLAFDSFLVIRHAPGHCCYFCTDSLCIPSAPATPLPAIDTCTLTRPAVAAMAAAAAAELLVSLLCHPLGLRAPMQSLEDSSSSSSSSSSSPSAAHTPLGPTFNLLRVSLPLHRSITATLPSDPRCVACSPVLHAAGTAWVLGVLAASGEGQLRELLVQGVGEEAAAAGGGGGGSSSGAAASQEEAAEGPGEWQCC